MKAWIGLFARQLALVLGAVLAYFGVRGLTEGDVGRARSHAADLLALERRLGIDIETTLQRTVVENGWLLTAANWVYIWLHWPLLTGTLVWLLIAHRDRYIELRNAIFVSGAIGMVIYAALPLAPPRLFSAEFIDTVTLHSHSYRVLQPPGLVNKYAAMPSLHVGWNLLAGIAWWHAGQTGAKPHAWSFAAITMPVAMAWATIATGNHWVLDAIVGSAVALIGLVVARRITPHSLEHRDHVTVADRGEVPVVLADGAEQPRRVDGDVPVGGGSEIALEAVRRYRHGQHDARGASGPCDLARSSRGGAGGEPVVHHHDDVAPERV